jgi:hypothetical protein
MWPEDAGLGMEGGGRGNQGLKVVDGQFVHRDHHLPVQRVESHDTILSACR